MEDLKAVVGDQSELRDEQLSKLHLGVFQGMVVTTKANGVVPLNSRVVATVEKGAEEALIDYLAEHDLLREQVRELVAALERTSYALELAFSKKPLRDMAETLAEAAHVLTKLKEAGS